MPIDYNFPPKGAKSAQGWYNRGRLPHFDGRSIPQFLTFRIFDSVPQSLIKKWKENLSSVQFRKKVEKFLDAGYGSCYLKDPRVARIIADNLEFHNGKKYDLHAWVIMPNHTHVLTTPFEGVELSVIAHSMKSYTAHEANKVLGRSGRFLAGRAF